MAGQRFQRIERRFRAHDLHHFHLVKLMLADHATGVTAIRTGFRAKARGVRAVAHRQLLGLHQFVAHEVGHRHFGGGHQIKGVFATRHAEQVFLELGQLAGAAHRVGIDHVRHVHFGVAVFADMGVQHELRQRAVQAGHLPLEHGKTAAGQLGGSVKVQAQRGTQIDMVFHRKIKRTRRTDAAHFHVVAFIAAHRHRFVRQVGNGHQQRRQTVLQQRQRGFVGFQFIGQTGHFGHDRRGVFAFALGFAYLLGQRIAPCLQVLRAGLQRFALVFHLGKGVSVQGKAPASQAGGHGRQVVAKQLNIKHELILIGVFGVFV